MSAGLDNELARLRARAYGPDADIHADPPALARLRELERRASEARRGGDGSADPPSRDAVSTEGVGADGLTAVFGELFAEPTAVVTRPRRRSSARTGSAVHPQPAGSPPAPPLAAHGAPESAPEVPLATDVSRPPLIAPASLVTESFPTALGRRTRLAWVASLVVAVIVAAGLAVWTFPFGVRDDQHHDARMAHVDGEIPARTLDRLASTWNSGSVENVTVRSFGEFEGLAVYAVGECLLGVVGDSLMTIALGCAGGGLDPTIEVWVPAQASSIQQGQPALPEDLTRRYPDGVLLRFTLRGAEVLVDEGSYTGVP
jgi:hypothetical protein